MASTDYHAQTKTFVIPEWLDGLVAENIGNNIYRVDEDTELRIVQWHDIIEVVIFCSCNSRFTYCTGHRKHGGDIWTFDGRPPNGVETKLLRCFGRAQVLMADLVDAYEAWLSEPTVDEAALLTLPR